MIFDASEFIKQWNQTGQSTLLPLIWYFGDGESTTGTIVNHTYANPGTYVLGVSATDERGYGSLHEKSINVKEQTPVTVNIVLSNKFIQTGQQVTINGNLSYNGSGVQNEWITLSSTTYPFTQWNEIATVKTDKLGQYSFDWKVFYGYYHVKATWEGNSTYPESSISVVLIVESFGDLINEYYSNSTVTGMNYNVTSRILKFQAEGPSGTTGYTKIHIREDWKFDPEKINVLFDGQPLEYNIVLSDEIWILELNYNHSSHNVEVHFDMYSTLTSPNPTPTSTTTLKPSSALTSSPEPTQTALPSTLEIVLIVILVVVTLGLALNIIKKRRS